MNRFRIGIALLLLLLAAGLLSQHTMRRIHSPLAVMMEDAASHARAGELQTASALADSARGQWQRHRALTAALADHQPLEDIEALFAQLPVIDDAADFAAICLDLSRKLAAVYEAHDIAAFF